MSDQFLGVVKKNISPSQVSTWFNSPKDYIRRYFEGDKGFSTPQMKLGTAIHKLAEGGFVPLELPYELSEYKYDREIREDGLRYLAYFDKLQKEKTPDNVRGYSDIKTGKPWTYSQAYHDIKQMGYAWALFIEDETLEWVEGSIEHVELGDDDLPTGNNTLQTIQYERQAVLDQYGKILERFYTEVEEAYKAWQFKDQIDATAVVDMEKLSEWRDLMAEEKATKKKRDDIGKEIVKTMQSIGGDSFKAEDGKTIFLSGRTSYDFPDNLEVVMNNGDALTYKEAKEMLANIGDAVKNAESAYKCMAEPKSVSYSLMVSR